MKLLHGSILGLVIIMLLISCTKAKPRNDEITKIELATGDCFRYCPVTAVSIDTSLNYGYYGGRYAKIKGYYTGKISIALWDTLNIKLKGIHYQNLRDYNFSVDDDQELELIIHYQNKIKHITVPSSMLPDSISKVFYWIANTYKLVKLSPKKDTIKFETKYQNPPPAPSVNMVKFPSSKSRYKN